MKRLIYKLNDCLYALFVLKLHYYCKVLQNLIVSLVLMVSEQEKYFKMTQVLWHSTSVVSVSFGEKFQWAKELHVASMYVKIRAQSSLEILLKWARNHCTLLLYQGDNLAYRNILHEFMLTLQLKSRMYCIHSAFIRTNLTVM